MLVHKSFIARVCQHNYAIKKNRELCVCIIFADFLFKSNDQRDIFHKVVTFQASHVPMDRKNPPLLIYAIGKAKRLPQKHSFTVKYVLNNFFRKEAAARNIFCGIFNFQFCLCYKFCRFFAFFNCNVVTYKLRADSVH